jgi:hypothetical protein
VNVVALWLCWKLSAPWWVWCLAIASVLLNEANALRELLERRK